MGHLSETTLKQQLDAAASSVGIGRRYAHYKHPDQAYRVTGVAILEATDEVAIVYQAEYGQRLAFVRSLKSWQEAVDVDGTRQPRFRLLG